MELTDFITTVFVMVDDLVMKCFPARTLRSRGALPRLSDSEVITMEVVGEFLGIHTDSGIWRYFVRHWRSLFPEIGDRTAFGRQAANLWYVKAWLWHRLSEEHPSALHIIDSMPLPVCRFARARHVRGFRDTASWGKSWGETFFGYKLHLKISDTGMIHAFALGPANEHDIHYVEPLTEGDYGWVLGDRGYRSRPLQEELWQRGLYLHATRHRNDKRGIMMPYPLAKRCSSIRRLVETVSGQLHDRFAIKATSARDLWHLSSRIVRKIFAHTVAVALNCTLGHSPLRMESLVAA
jgi:IS5 family transposase